MANATDLAIATVQRASVTLGIGLSVAFATDTTSLAFTIDTTGSKVCLDGVTAPTADEPHVDAALFPGTFDGVLRVAVPLVVETVENAGETLARALVDKIAGVVGGSAHIARTRIPVWTLENYRRLGATEEQLLQAFPTLRRADLQAAWAYVASNAAEIEHDIAANEST